MRNLHLIIQEGYLDVYQGIKSDIVSSSRFDENSDISTTYLGRIENMEYQDKLKAEESFPISEKGLHLRQATRWHKMSATIRHWH